MQVARSKATSRISITRSTACPSIARSGLALSAAMVLSKFAFSNRDILLLHTFAFGQLPRRRRRRGGFAKSARRAPLKKPTALSLTRRSFCRSWFDEGNFTVAVGGFGWLWVSG